MIRDEHFSSFRIIDTTYYISRDGIRIDAHWNSFASKQEAEDHLETLMRGKYTITQKQTTETVSHYYKG